MSLLQYIKVPLSASANKQHTMSVQPSDAVSISHCCFSFLFVQCRIPAARKKVTEETIARQVVLFNIKQKEL